MATPTPKHKPLPGGQTALPLPAHNIYPPPGGATFLKKKPAPDTHTSRATTQWPARGLKTPGDCWRPTLRPPWAFTCGTRSHPTTRKCPAQLRKQSQKVGTQRPAFVRKNGGNPGQQGRSGQGIKLSSHKQDNPYPKENLRILSLLFGNTNGSPQNPAQDCHCLLSLDKKLKIITRTLDYYYH